MISGLSALGWKSILALMWLGPLGTALSYLFWMLVMRRAPVASLALTLFVQPVFGSVWGYVFLGERLSQVQAAGAVLIIGAMLAQTLVERMQPATRAASLSD